MTNRVFEQYAHAVGELVMALKDDRSFLDNVNDYDLRLSATVTTEFGAILEELSRRRDVDNPIKINRN